MSARRSLAVLYGQTDQMSTSYQTSQLVRALEPWFEPLHLRVGALKSGWRGHAARVAKNYLWPLVRQPAVDDVIYGNDGAADLSHWRCRRILYWYDAPEDWSLRPPARRQLVRRLRYKNVLAADHVFAVSGALVEVGRKLRAGRAPSVSYLPVGVDCDRFDPERADANEVRRLFSLPKKTVVGYLGYVGIVAGRFAGEPLAEISRALRDRHDLHFLVVGFGPGLEAFQRRVAGLGVAESFTFTGFVPSELLPSCIAAMDITVDTLETGFHAVARSETKLKQYMAMGRACVATRIGENIVDLDGGECGVLVPPTREALLEGISALVFDEARRRRLGEAALRRAREQYHWPRLAERMAAALGVTWPS